jgi:putative transcriptional regulator
MSKRQVENSVREERIKRALSQQRLADITQLARQSIISIEKGRFLPTIENALLLSEALNVPVGKLFWLKKGQK